MASTTANLSRPNRSDLMELTKRSPRGEAAKVVRLLREDVLQKLEGAFLGSEEELLARYEISRQTLRQAARVLENEQMLRVRRGVGGGYYVARPTLETIGRTAATYLRIRQISLDDVVEAGQLMTPTLTRRAILSRDEDTRKELAELLGAVDETSDFSTSAVFLSWANQTLLVIARLAGNPALELMTSVLGHMGFEAGHQSFYANRPDRMSAWAKVRRKLMAAILERDVDVALLYAQRGNQFIKDWLAEDHEAAVKPRRAARMATTRDRAPSAGAKGRK